MVTYLNARNQTDSLQNKLSNQYDDIAKRIREIEEDKFNLPYYPPYPNAKPRESVFGHWQLVDDRLNAMKRTEKNLRDAIENEKRKKDEYSNCRERMSPKCYVCIVNQPAPEMSQRPWEELWPELLQLLLFLVSRGKIKYPAPAPRPIPMPAF